MASENKSEDSSFQVHQMVDKLSVLLACMRPLSLKTLCEALSASTGLGSQPKR